MEKDRSLFESLLWTLGAIAVVALIWWANLHWGNNFFRLFTFGHLAGGPQLAVTGLYFLFWFLFTLRSGGRGTMAGVAVGVALFHLVSALSALFVYCDWNFLAELGAIGTLATFGHALMVLSPLACWLEPKTCLLAGTVASLVWTLWATAWVYLRRAEARDGRYKGPTPPHEIKK